jgi:Flp pilus assembly secretin CpaC
MRFQLGVYGRTLIGAASIALAGSALGGAARAQEVIDVTIDFAKVLRLDHQAKTIVVGNPGIADASVEDDKTVVLTGKAAGTTNIIVLDAKGEEIANAVLRVSSNVRQLTTVFYGSHRQTFSCAPTCEQVILVGDEPTVFKNATEQIQGRQQFANGQ